MIKMEKNASLLAQATPSSPLYLIMSFIKFVCEYLYASIGMFPAAYHRDRAR
jgi:hypothetical protein